MNKTIQFLTITLCGLTLSELVNAGPSRLLNDTGSINCHSDIGLNDKPACDFPFRDSLFGRDAAAINPKESGFTKPDGSAGNGGFAFTPLDVNGNPISLVGDPPVPVVAPHCIWDRVTNLVWEVKTEEGLQNYKSTYGWGSNNTGTCTDGAGCSTDAYISDVNKANICGETEDDWRLPSRMELLSIVDAGHILPSIDQSFFPYTAYDKAYTPPWNNNPGFSSQPDDGARYWSGDENVAGKTESWVIGFNNGSSYPRQWLSASYIRLVRGIRAKPPTNNRYTDNSDGTITDNLTKLVWDKCSFGLSGDSCNIGSARSLLGNSTQDDIYNAITLANKSSYKGYSDWRMPNRNELSSLLDLSVHHPAIDSVAFPNTPSAEFLSSTISSWLVDFYMHWVYQGTFESSYFRSVDFAEGGETFTNYSNGYSSKEGYLRLVRGGSDFDAYGSRDKWTPPPLSISSAETMIFNDGTGNRLVHSGGIPGGTIAYSAFGENGANCKVDGDILTATGGAGACSVVGTMEETDDYHSISASQAIQVLDANNHLFHIVIKKPRHGLVVSSPEKIKCGGTNKQCIGDLAHFKLTAHPNPGYSFGGWVGCPDMTYDDSDNEVCVLNADNRDLWHQKRRLPLKNRYRGFAKALFIKSRKHMQ